MVLYAMASIILYQWSDSSIILGVIALSMIPYCLKMWYYLIQHYVIKFVSDLRLFYLGTAVSSTNITDRHSITEILLKVALNTKMVLYAMASIILYQWSDSSIILGVIALSMIPYCLKMWYCFLDTASKHAIQSFSDTLRAEVADDNIHVCVVNPGYIRTNLSHNFESRSGQVYLIQHYGIKFVSDLRPFYLGTAVSSTNITDRHSITEILLKVATTTSPNHNQILVHVSRCII
jgi:hypothetical protein